MKCYRKLNIECPDELKCRIHPSQRNTCENEIMSTDQCHEDCCYYEETPGKKHCYKKPACQPVDLANSITTCSGAEEGDQCKFECDFTHELDGEEQIQCEEVDGQLDWSPSIPVCRPKVCTDIEELAKRKEGLIVECDSGNGQRTKMIYQRNVIKLDP